MQNIQLLLELTVENKARFRELVMKYHPDRGGDTEIAKRIINAKDSDEAVEGLYNELILGKTEQEKHNQTYTYKKQEKPFSERWKDRFSSKEERDMWHEKVKTKRERKSQRERRRQRK